MIKHNKTRKQSIMTFQKEITVVFMEMIVMIKLFHWKTKSYSIHKSTDELYAKINTNVDNFIEILLGKTGLRTDLTKNKSIRLIDINSEKQFISEINYYKKYLIGLDNNIIMKKSNNDLYNIRDNILGDLNQLLYLLTFN